MGDRGSNSRSQRKEINRNVHFPRSTIFALLASFGAGGAATRFAAGGLLRNVIQPQHQQGFARSRATFGSFVSAVPLTPSMTRSSSRDEGAVPSTKAAPVETCEMESESCSASQVGQNILSMPSKSLHPKDPRLWLYHAETTTSTMDEAKSIVEKKFAREDGSSTDGDAEPTSFLISATSQSNGRGTTERKWESAQKGNALFTIGVPQSSWMSDLKSKNGGRMVPLTLLPLKVGSLVAFHVQRALDGCAVSSGEAAQGMPRATVKWPNDVLLKSPRDNSHDKIAGILIETAQDWFVIGIGINVAYAPNIPSEGANRGRKATCLSHYCQASEEIGYDAGAVENYWIELSKKLATDIAYDLHLWLHSPSLNEHSGEAILDQWKSYIDWDMELALRDTPKREKVTLKDILEDGRVVVQEVETGARRTLVSDYFL